MSTTRLVLGAIRDVLSNVPEWRNRVLIGHPPAGKPAQVPALYITLDSVETTQEDELGGYRRSLTVAITAFVAAEDDTAEARTFAGADALDRVMVELQRERATTRQCLGGLVDDLTISGTSLSGDEIGIGGVGVMGAELRAYFLAIPSEGA